MDAFCRDRGSGKTQCGTSMQLIDDAFNKIEGHEGAGFANGCWPDDRFDQVIVSKEREITYPSWILASRPPSMLATCSFNRACSE